MKGIKYISSEEMIAYLQECQYDLFPEQQLCRAALSDEDKIKYDIYDKIAKKLRALSEISLADVRPVIHARWEKDEEDLKWGSHLVKRFCSNCKQRAYLDKEKYKFVLTDFCPNCGAMMDEEK